MELNDDLSPAALFSSVGSSVTGRVRWGQRIPSATHGVYIVSIHADPADSTGLAAAPIDMSAVAVWMALAPAWTVNGRRLPAEEVADHMARWWLPRTSILYIGTAKTLSSRVSAYYRTDLGAHKPHAGGYWLKTLSILPEVTVHYHVADGPIGTERALESRLQNSFLSGYGSVPAEHPEPRLPLPWANLEIVKPAPRRRRDHGISDRRSAASSSPRPV